MTHYRRRILEIIHTSEEHMTAEQIFFVLKKESPSVVMATVYNNLNHLCRLGYIRRICLEGQPERYDRNTRHDHLICVCCGAICDITLLDLTEKLEGEVGVPIDGYELKIRYLCPQCTQKRSAQETAPG